MIEMADHIGPQATLLLLERFGGEEIRISRTDRQRARFAEAIGDEAARVFQEAFAPSKLDLPVAFDAIRRAKGKPLIDQVRARQLSVAEAARILKVSRKRIHDWMTEADSKVKKRLFDGNPPRRRARLSPAYLKDQQHAHDE